MHTQQTAKPPAPLSDSLEPPLFDCIYRFLSNRMPARFPLCILCITIMASFTQLCYNHCRDTARRPPCLLSVSHIIPNTTGAFP